MLLVRHGHAGTKEQWAGDDQLRPLDTRGRRQAKHIVEVVAPYRPKRILSSPHMRCLQTMEPLALKTHLTIEQEPALVPLAGPRAIEVVRSLSTSKVPGAVVVCTHGEVLGEVLSAIASEDGLRLGRRVPGLKGCVWALEFPKGRAVVARYFAPSR
jgi:8-oxo-dGTP diphosphatase